MVVLLVFILVTLEIALGGKKKLLDGRKLRRDVHDRNRSF